MHFKARKVGTEISNICVNWATLHIMVTCFLLQCYAMNAVLAWPLKSACRLIMELTFRSGQLSYVLSMKSGTDNPAVCSGTTSFHCADKSPSPSAKWHEKIQQHRWEIFGPQITVFTTMCSNWDLLEASWHNTLFQLPKPSPSNLWCVAVLNIYPLPP